MNGKYKNVPHTYLLEAIRNSSHNTSTATAEFIDNSLDANADNVWIDFDKKKFEMFVADDGDGMIPEQMLKAVALGCHDNVDAKLGRFGVGLNTSALHLGDSFSLYSKTETGVLHRVDFNPSEMMATKEWANHITDDLTTDEIALFNKAIRNAPSGTLLVVYGINRNFKSYQAVTGFSNTLLTNMGQMFRYFLPPQVVGQNEVSEDAAKNSRLRLYVDGNCVSGKDPLERNCPNTRTVAKGVIETDYGNIDYTLVELDDADEGKWYQKPTYYHQGIYVVREGREIMEHDKQVFYEIWGREHSTATHLRCELSYNKELDRGLLVNHDKVGIKEVDQSIMDKLRDALKNAIQQFKNNWAERRSKRPNEEIQLVHEATCKNLEANSSQLNLPSARKARRKKGGPGPDGVKEPTESKKSHKGGKHTVGSSNGELSKDKIKKFVTEHVDMTASGPALRFDFAANNTLLVQWNTSHPFVQKYITLMKDAPAETIKALDNMAFAMASYWEQKTLESEDFWNEKDNFLGILGQNLRIVK